MSASDHWQSVYLQKAPDSVSWFQPAATISRALIEAVGTRPDTAIVDVGGGASTLVDALLGSGYTNVTVLDIAPAALEVAQARLGERARAVTWYTGDVLALQLPDASVDVWHDRAVFHFLVTPEARERYVAQVRRVLRPGGHIVLATFAEDGPLRCSGLPVARYTPQALHATFGDDFLLVSSQREGHVTPTGAVQMFTYCVCRYALTGKPRDVA